MKRFLTSICLFFIITIAANAAPLSTKMNKYLAKVEKECAEWSKEEWSISKGEYKAFVDEFKANKDKYSQEEKDAINRAIGRYNGLLVKHGMEEFGDFLQGIGERIPSLWEGFKSAFEKKQ